jgi:hypothetical protein|tara:strand:- start:257 stop:904 length:648 start_codon:yes stop_codon:yes gene_type:complete
MTTPYLHSHLFEINDNIVVKDHNIGGFKYQYIDNFYKRPNDIYNMLSDSWVPNWKINPNSRNFKEYFDCRMDIDIRSQGIIGETKTMDTLRKIFKDDTLTCSKISMNIFSWIIAPKNNVQFLPHQDPYKNVLVYLDKEDCGGTAIYQNAEGVENYDESNDIRHDVSKYKKDIIQAKFNRCVIFDGNTYHGGYIDDHHKYSNGKWRYNAVYFLNHG